MAAKTWHKKSAVKIQHCPISSKFDMWVDNDVPNWFLTLKNFYRLPFSKWPPQYCTNSTLSDFNDISYVGRLWCPELIPDIENFYRSPFSKWPPQYRKNSILFDFKGSFWFIYGHFVCCWFAVYRYNKCNRKHIIFCCCFKPLCYIYHSTHLHITFIHIVDGAKLKLL